MITNGLINWLDASILSLSGFSNNQTLLDSFIPDQVGTNTWHGSNGYSMYVATNASPLGDKPVIRFITGNLTPSNFNDYLLTQEYFAFDVISITNDEYNQYRNILKKFLNYDGIIINQDTRQIINYDSI